MPRAAARRRPRFSLGQSRGVVRGPYPGFIAPCLATPGHRLPARGQWVHEIKHDGYRAQAHLRAGKSTIFTRNGYDWTPRFRQIADALEPLRGHDLVLNGEIVVMDERGVSDFHLLQDELAQKAPERLTYWVFDLLYLDGFDLRAAALQDRKRALSQLLGKGFDKASRIQASNTKLSPATASPATSRRPESRTSQKRASRSPWSRHRSSGAHGSLVRQFASIRLKRGQLLPIRSSASAAHPRPLARTHISLRSQCQRARLCSLR
jgi:hypothetical protein